MSDEEFAKVYAAAGPSIQIAMDLAVLTGQRQGDILSLSREQLLADGIAFDQGKTGARRLVEWSAELERVITRAKALPPQLPGLYVVRTSHGKRYSESGFQSNWQRLMRKVYPDKSGRWTFHDLRAKSASDERDLADATARLGHADPRTTKRVYRRGFEHVKPLR